MAVSAASAAMLVGNCRVPGGAPWAFRLLLTATRVMNKVYGTGKWAALEPLRLSRRRWRPQTSGQGRAGEVRAGGHAVGGAVTD